jgi:hypothetical protein
MPLLRRLVPTASSIIDEESSETLTYSIDTDTKLVRVDARAITTFSEWERVMRFVLGDSLFDPGYSILTDRRGANAGTPACLRAAARFAEDLVESSAVERIAVVVTAPEVFEATRMRETLSERIQGLAKIFTDPESAEAWLGERDESAGTTASNGTEGDGER